MKNSQIGQQFFSIKFPNGRMLDIADFKQNFDAMDFQEVCCPCNASLCIEAL